MFSIAPLSLNETGVLLLCCVRDLGRALNAHGSFPRGNEGVNISMRLLRYAYMYMYRIRDYQLYTVLTLKGGAVTSAASILNLIDHCLVYRCKCKCNCQCQSHAPVPCDMTLCVHCRDRQSDP